MISRNTPKNNIQLNMCKRRDPTIRKAELYSGMYGPRNVFLAVMGKIEKKQKILKIKSLKLVHFLFLRRSLFASYSISRILVCCSSVKGSLCRILPKHLPHICITLLEHIAHPGVGRINETIFAPSFLISVFSIIFSPAFFDRIGQKRESLQSPFIKILGHFHISYFSFQSAFL